MQKKHFLILLVAIYVGSAIGTFSARAISQPSQTADQVAEDMVEGDGETMLGTLLAIDPSEPRDQVCPLNGQLFTNTERQAWEKRRPLAVMIENSPDARPQSGLSSADVVYEAVAEGGVTRFMALFYCAVQANDTIIAPVRSARTYFVDWASGYNWPLYVHVGGANLPGPSDALGQIADYGWALENDLNQFSIGYPTFVRNASRLGRDVATEHTMETSTERLWEVGEERGWTNMSPALKVGSKAYPASDWKDNFTGWSFLDEAPTAGSVSPISYDFWSGYNQFSVSWTYDPATNTYQRTMAGEPHLDLNTDKQIAASTVIVLLTQEKGPINELKHMLYKTTGSGKALMFHNGTVEQVTWEKADREAELTFEDAKGNPAQLQPGLVWISVLDDSSEVEYPSS